MLETTAQQHCHRGTQYAELFVTNPLISSGEPLRSGQGEDGFKYCNDSKNKYRKLDLLSLNNDTDDEAFSLFHTVCQRVQFTEDRFLGKN